MVAPVGSAASRWRSFLVSLFLSVGLSVWVACGVGNAQVLPPATAAAAPLQPTKLEATVARVVSQMMPRLHYERLELNDTLSRRFFESYLDRLDPDRSFFLASDVAEFGASADQMCGFIVKGRLEFPYAMYGRLLQRAEERIAFVKQEVVKPVSFTTDEELLLDRAKAPWCESPAALDELWRKKVKNQLLAYQLLEERGKKEAAAAGANPAGDAGKDAFVPPPPPERVVRFYESFLGSLRENGSTEVAEMILNAFTQVYDPHSNYMAPTSEEDFNIHMRLSLQGIGAVLSSEDGYVKVVELKPGGPAELDGRLQSGDRIIAVAQEGKEPVDVINMNINKVVRQIRGPKGTKVTLTVLKAAKGLHGLPVTIVLTRDEIKLTEQEASLEQLPLPGVSQRQVALITLPSFYSDFDGRRNGDKDFKSSARDVERLLGEAVQAGAAGVILDLRSDGGGSLEDAVSIAGLFLPKGPVVQVRNSDRDTEIQRSNRAQPLYTGPLVVLVNRLSASASEIVAAVLQDYGRAVIIGEGSTHGKGTVQTVIPLDQVMNRPFQSKAERDPGALKLTIGKFYRVNGGSTQRRGVIPDILFPSFTDYMELGESELPNALAWDEIPALPLPKLANSVRPLLPTIKKRANERLAADPDVQAFRAAVREYGELRSVKSVTLNREKREGLMLKEEEFADRIEATTFRARNKAATKKDDKPPAKDLMLGEALQVMADLVRPEALLAAAPVVPPTGKP